MGGARGGIVLYAGGRAAERDFWRGDWLPPGEDGVAISREDTWLMRGARGECVMYRVSVVVVRGIGSAVVACVRMLILRLCRWIIAMNYYEDLNRYSFF